MYFRLFFLLVGLICANASLTHALPGPGLQAVVTVWSDDPEERFLGSATIVEDGASVITNAHVVGSARTVLLETADGQRRKAQVVAVDTARDLALLKPDSPYAAGLAKATGDPALSDTVFAIGSPLGSGLAVTAGIVSATKRQIDPTEPVQYLQHSAPVNPGSSGGALLDANGRLVGINTRIADGSRYFVGIAYATPVSEIMAFLSDPHRVATPGPGLEVRRITRRIADALGLADRDGVLIEHVVAGGPADRAGLQPGDILLQLGETRITAPGDIALALAATEPPDTVRIRRDGGEMVLDMDLEQRSRALNPATVTDVAQRTDYNLPEMGLTVDETGTIQEMAGGTIGFFAGLNVGDTILAVNGKAVASLEKGWQNELRFTRPALVLLRLSDGSTRHVMLDPWAKTTQLRPSSGANVVDQDVVAF